MKDSKKSVVTVCLLRFRRNDWSSAGGLDEGRKEGEV
jgi:hypothetical protein